MIRVFVADDHLLIREGLRKVFEHNADIEVVGEACTGTEVLSCIHTIPFDILLLDLRFPDKNGIDILLEMPCYVRKKTLVISVYDEEVFAKRVIRCGAGGYITKDCAPETLCAAMYKIVHGGRYISEHLAEELAVELFARSEKAPHEILSDREFQVLLMLGYGESVGEIAATISLSINTVNSYRHRILEKMNLHSTIELVQYAMRHHLVE